MRQVKSGTWLGRMRRKGGGAGAEKAATLGVVAVEVARLMYRAAQLWHAFRDDRVARLSDDVIRQEGVRRLVADDDDFLLALALAELTDDLASLARSVARLAPRCSDPVLRRFDAAFADVVKSGADPFGFEYAGRKMERKVRKMERFVVAGASLCRELEVLAELEQGLRWMMANPDAGHHPRRVTGLRNRVLWQRQQVKHLREASLWFRTFDYAVRLLGRSLFSIVGRIRQVFGFQLKEEEAAELSVGRLPRSRSVAGPILPADGSPDGNAVEVFPPGSIDVTKHGSRSGSLAAQNRGFATQCLPVGGGLSPPARKHQNSRTKRPASSSAPCVTGGNETPVLKSCISLDSSFRKKPNVMPLSPNRAEEESREARPKANMIDMDISLSMIKPRFRLLSSPAATLGAAALALHYANVILLIEKIVTCPHLIDTDARDELYGMLTRRIRADLRFRLKSNAKNSASSDYNPVLAAEEREAVTGMLEWLSPLAHNMIRWQAERSFEQQSPVRSSNVLLLQTLHYANQKKAEDAITDLLVGLNYLWRYRRESNAKAILECVSSRNVDDYVCSSRLKLVLASPAMQG